MLLRETKIQVFPVLQDIFGMKNLSPDNRVIGGGGPRIMGARKMGGVLYLHHNQQCVVQGGCCGVQAVLETTHAISCFT